MTSNLIALWSLQQKETQALEEARHNKEQEKLSAWANRMKEWEINANYTLDMMRLKEQERANRANEALGFINAQATLDRNTIQRRYNDSMVALNERKRVDEAYYRQKELNYKERVESEKLRLAKRQQDWKEQTDIVNFGMRIFNDVILGGLALE